MLSLAGESTRSRAPSKRTSRARGTLPDMTEQQKRAAYEALAELAREAQEAGDYFG
jgi:hypothetical protein